jgi:uncharacterized protein YqeY
MSLVTDVNRRIAEAMKAQDQTALRTFRMLKAALTNREIEKRHALDGAESLQVVAGLIKQRRDSIEQFARGGRDDLVAKEQAELAILEQLMPPPVTPAELDEAVDAAIARTGAATLKDMGRVMKAVMGAFGDRPVDGKQVSELVRKKLGG